MKKRIKKNINRKINRSRKRRNRKDYSFPFFSILISFLVLLIVGFLIFTNVNIAWKRAELTERVDVLRKEVQVLEQKNQELRTKIIQTDEGGFLEKKAREELGLKKPGEEVVVILPAKEDVEKIVEEEKSFWQKIQDWFLAF